MDYKTKFEEAERYVRRLTEEFNMLNMENARLQDEKRELESRFNEYHDEQGRFSSGNGAGGIKAIDNSKKSVRLDSNGKPFKYPTVRLPTKEYANVVDEIGRTWHTKYKGKGICRLFFTGKIYSFENRGIGDYNIYKVEEYDE